MAPPSLRRTFWHEPLLGTRVIIQLDGVDDDTAARAEVAMVAEIERLERVFSVFDRSSELCRWRRGELAGDRLDAGLVHVLALAAEYFVRSGGAFSPVVGELMARWRQAERTGVVPTAEERRGAVVATLPYRVQDGAVVTLDDCGAVDLNAIAKGHIVDAAVAVGRRSLPAGSSVLINAGGDLLHRGGHPVLVGIEDPRTPYDNAAPLAVVELADQALATSGPSRRGFRVAGRWFGHVLDPGRGEPVETVRSASVIAPDALQADAVATVVGVLDTEEAMAFAAELDGVGVFLLRADGEVADNAVWRAQRRGG